MGLTSWDAHNHTLNWSPHCHVDLFLFLNTVLHTILLAWKTEPIMVSAENPPVTSLLIHKSQPSLSEPPDSVAVTSLTASAEAMPFSPSGQSPLLWPCPRLGCSSFK